MTLQEKQNLINYRLSKAKTTFQEIDLLVKNELWNTAVNRLYYACFYAINALLITKDIMPQTHGGVRLQFGLHFIKTGIIDKELGTFFSDLFDVRLTSDYDDYIDFTQSDVLEMIEPVSQLLTHIAIIHP